MRETARAASGRMWSHASVSEAAAQGAAGGAVRAGRTCTSGPLGDTCRTGHARAATGNRDGRKDAVPDKSPGDERRTEKARVQGRVSGKRPRLRGSQGCRLPSPLLPSH